MCVPIVFILKLSSLLKANQWEQTEAALFVMQSVARNILPEESEVSVPSNFLHRAFVISSVPSPLPFSLPCQKLFFSS
jgi:hypothetical protein